MTGYTPIGMPDDVAYRLKALDKRRLRWPVLHLLGAIGTCVITYFAVSHTIAK